MQINIIRLQNSGIIREPIDTSLLLDIEFVLSNGRNIAARVENGMLYLHSSTGELKVAPRAFNAVAIEVPE